MLLTPRQYFQLHDSRPRKRFGQHFLSQPGIAERIVEYADLSKSDTAVEVGPGLGALTQFILPRVGALHLVELDRDLAAYLEESLPPSGPPVTIHCRDVLTFDFRSLSRAEGRRLVVLGNLPYNISSPLLFHLLDSFSSIGRAVFMVQKEVGERLTANPGGREYGVLSVLLGVYAKVKRLFVVGPAQFYPPPKVDSLTLRIDFAKDPPADPDVLKTLRSLVETAFKQRRKTLRNSLKGLPGAEKGNLEDAFSAAGVDPGRRPETLSSEEFLRLASALASR